MVATPNNTPVSGGGRLLGRDEDTDMPEEGQFLVGSGSYSLDGEDGPTAAKRTKMGG